MKVGLISDTHGRISAIRRAILAIDPVDLWLHAGDYSQDANYVKDLTGLEVIAVNGNCDPPTNKSYPDEFIELAGKKIWLTHGHKYNVGQNLSEIIWWGKKFEVDAVVYGHTHVAQITEQDGILIVNPGSPFLPRKKTRPSCALLEISDSVLHAEIIILEKE